MKIKFIIMSLAFYNLSFALPYILAKDGVYLIDNSALYIKRKWNKKFRDLFIVNDTIYGVGDSLYYLKEGEFVGIMEIPYEYRYIIKDENIYGISRHKIYNFINKKEISIIKNIIKFIKSYDKIWILDDAGLSAYNLNPGLRYFEEEYRLPLEFKDNPDVFALSNYGLRLYVVKEKRIDVFDTETFSYITTIPINEEIKKIKFNNDKLYCITTKKIYIINNRIKNKINLSAKDIYFSDSMGVIIKDMEFYLFDAKKDKIIKRWTDNLLDFKVIDTIAYFLTTDRMTAMNISGKLKVLGSIKINTPYKIIKDYTTYIEGIISY